MVSISISNVERTLSGRNIDTYTLPHETNKLRKYEVMVSSSLSPSVGV
jgi:hypothetical protein